VVAVRDDVHFDPLDDSGAIEPAVERSDYDEDVPPPPSPTSVRAMAPVVAAMAVGVLLAYLVVVGLDTAGDESSGSALPPSENAEAGMENTEVDVAASGEQPPAVAADEPLALVEEPIVAVGDPPPAGAEPVEPAAADPPSAGAAPAELRTPAPASGPRAGQPPSARVADAPPPAARPGAAASDLSSRPAAAGVGSLLVRSRPPGATVRVDGAEVGVTPVEVPDVAFGTHLVRIELPGYRPWVSDVDISGTEQVRVGASLEPGERR
jgi:hypothetical protein